MAKRMTDTNKWRKPFIRALPTPYKLFWFYILDDCDHAGIWIVDMEVAQIRIGEAITAETALETFKGKVTVFDNGERWFMPDFVEFQYGQLNESNRAHNSVINTLLKYKLLNKNKALTRPLQGAKEKEKVKEKDKEKERIPSFKEFKEYALSKKPDINMEALKLKYDAWIESGWRDGFGNPIKNWKTKLLNTIPHLPEKRFDKVSKVEKDVINFDPIPKGSPMPESLRKHVDNIGK